jgi:hypothetical protein
MRELQTTLMERDVEGIQAFLDEFPDPANGEWREAAINQTGELVLVRNFPLPDGFAPDYVDLLLMVPDYPRTPPIGIYLMEKNNRALIGQLKRIFNVMNWAAHDAPTVEGYAWICVIYQGLAWKYNARDPARGDNLRKHLIHFYNRCQSEIGG